MDENSDMQFPAHNKRQKIKRVEKCVLSVLLALVLAAAAFIAGWFGRWAALGKKKQALLWAIDTALENYYRDVDEDALYNQLFAAFEFDPYSTFYTAEEYESIAARREGDNRGSGFSVYTEEHSLQIYNVVAGSSAAEATLEKDMYFLKYGKTDDKAKMLSATSAENYFTFAGKLKEGEKYYVLCGNSENEAEAEVYELIHGADGAGFALTRKYEPMRLYQVMGNSPAERVGLKRGMYILKYGLSDNAEEMVSGSFEDLNAFVVAARADAQQRKADFAYYMQCGFEKDGTDAKIYKMVEEEYKASYCLYRDKEEACYFRTVKKSGGGEELVKVAVEGETLDLGDNTAYIAITEFTGNAAEEFQNCLKVMNERKRTNLILDLRGNGGGYMDVFVKIAAYMLRDAGTEAPKVAYAKFRSGETVSYSAKKSMFNEYFKADSRVSVLADEFTASASECLIGALVDYKTTAFSDIYLRKNAQGVARTYGKGIMQTHYDGPDGSVLKLTAADIFWPKSNKSIHGVGVVPADGANEIFSAVLPGATDTFLQAAAESILSKPSLTPATPAAPV